MKSLVQLLLALSSVLLLLTACNKTSKDNYYLNCKINGQYWEPEKPKALWENNLTASYETRINAFKISALNGKEKIFIGLIDSNINAGKTYILTHNYSTYHRAIYHTDFPTQDFYTNDTYTGEAYITLLDKEKLIIEGRFHFTAYDSVTAQTVNITDGKFRLKYKIY